MAVVYLAGLAAACSSSGDLLFSGAGGPSTLSGGGSAQAQGAGGASVASSSQQAASSQASSVQAVTSVAASTAVSSAASGGNDKLIDCGEMTCDITAGQACCYDKYGFYKPQPQTKCVTGDIYNDNCETMQTGWGAATRIECEGPASCGSGEVCCARRKTFFDGNQQYPLYDQLTCQKSCNYPDIVVCDANTTCPMLPKQQGGGFVQGVCQQSSLLPKKYLVCGYP